MKNKSINLRLTEDNKEIIKRKAVNYGMNITEYITYAAVHFETMEQVSEKLDKIVEKMIGTPENTPSEPEPKILPPVESLQKKPSFVIQNAKTRKK